MRSRFDLRNCGDRENPIDLNERFITKIKHLYIPIMSFLEEFDLPRLLTSGDYEESNPFIDDEDDELDGQEDAGGA